MRAWRAKRPRSQGSRTKSNNHGSGRRKRYGKAVVSTVWSALGVQRRAASVTGLLAEVANITVATGHRYVWRGVRDATYGLHSSLERRLRSSGIDVTSHNLGVHERDLIDRARDAQFRQDLPRAELLAMLQHAGAATPLLDVTPDPFVALFFATEPVGEIKPCALIAIRVPGAAGTLGESHTFRGSLPGGSSERDPVHTRLLAQLSLPDTSTEPILWEAPYVDDRMRAQRGMFLATTAPEDAVPYGSIDFRFGARDQEMRSISHLVDRDRGQYSRPSVVVFYVPSAMRRQVSRELDRRFGYRTETIYPDLPGFALANAATRLLQR